MKLEEEIREGYDKLLMEMKANNIEINEFNSEISFDGDSKYEIICKTQYQLFKWILGED